MLTNLTNTPEDIAKRIAMTNRKDNTQPPEAVMEPSVFDILMGRSGYCYSHVGNQSFRTLIDQNLGWYASVMKGRKREKMAVVSSIMNTISDGGGKFLRQSPYDLSWYEVSYKIAREKISHALRDQMNQKSTQRRPRMDALKVHSDLEEGAAEHFDDQWRNLVLKTFKLHRDRYESVTPRVMDRPIDHLGDSDAYPWLKPTDGQGISETEDGTIFNNGHHTDKHCIPQHEHNKVNVSLEESRKWFRSFTRDTLNESTGANIGAVTRPVGTDLQSYMGSGFNAANPSSMRGSHNILLEPLPSSPEWLMPSGTTCAKGVHIETNKALQSHCTRSMEFGNRSITKPSPSPTKLMTATPQPRECGSSETVMDSPHVPLNVVTPRQGPRPPPRELVTPPMTEKCLLPKLRSTSLEFDTQTLPKKSLPRLVSLEEESDKGTSDSARVSEANDNNTGGRKTFSDAKPTVPDQTAFASLFEDLPLDDDEWASSNLYSFASVDTTPCEDPQCFCLSNEMEPLPIDFGLPDMHGSSESYTNQQLDGMIADLF